MSTIYIMRGQIHARAEDRVHPAAKHEIRDLLTQLVGETELHGTNTCGAEREFVAKNGESK